MKSKLLCSVAILATALAGSALAETKITTALTNAVKTSKGTTPGSDTGTADDVTIASGGAINLTSGTALTVDSNNSVKLDGGTISINTAAAANTDGATGILVRPNTTGSVTLNSSITVTDGYTRTKDSNNMDNGVWAKGSGYKGVWIQGPGTMTGNVTSAVGGTIVIHGQNSYGILLDSNLNGKIDLLGAIAVTGENVTGAALKGNVTGDVNFGNAINATGPGAIGVDASGNIGGRLRIGSSVSVTGYNFTTRQVDTVMGWIGASADSRKQATAGVSVTGNVGNGIWLAAPPSTLDTTNTDADGDGVADASQARSTIALTGNAAALQVGGANNTTIGVLSTAGSKNSKGDPTTNAGKLSADGNSLEIAGTVIGSNYLDLTVAKVTDASLRSATAISLSGLGGTTTFAGGIHISRTGQVTASAYEGDTTAIWAKSGTIAPNITNDGLVTTNLYSQLTQDTVAAQGSPYALRIDAGANVPTLINRGTYSAAIHGLAGTAYGIKDNSGNVTSLTNEGTIQALVINDGPNATATNVVTGQGIAIDLSSGTKASNFVQQKGAVYRLPNGTTDITPADPVVIGAVKFGAGGTNVSVLAGSINGDVSFVGGANSILVDNGATVRGGLSLGTGTAAINVNNGTLDITPFAGTTATPPTLNLTSLNVGAKGVLAVTVTPGQTTPAMLVSGAANLASGSQLGLHVNGIITGQQRFTLIQAGTLNAGGSTLGLATGITPYMYAANLVTDATNKAVYADISLKSAATLGLNPAETAAYMPLITALKRDAVVMNTFLGKTSKNDFMTLFRAAIPEGQPYSLLNKIQGGRTSADAISSLGLVAEEGTWTSWAAQKIEGSQIRTDSDHRFNNTSYKLTGGFEYSGGGGEAIGLFVGFHSDRFRNAKSLGTSHESITSGVLGAYWRYAGSNLKAFAQVAGNYDEYKSEKDLSGLNYSRLAVAKWEGTGVQLAGGASYRFDVSGIGIEPSVDALAVWGNEDAHKLKDNTNANSLQNMNFSSVSNNAVVITPAVAFTYRGWSNSWFEPRLKVGYRGVTNFDAGGQKVSYGSDPSFTIPTLKVMRSGAMAELGFKASSPGSSSYVEFNVGAEELGDVARASANIRAFITF